MRIPKLHLRPTFERLLSLLLLGVSAGNLTSQSRGVEWTQVMRGEGFVIDIDPASLIISESGTIGATFRTAFSKSDTIGGAKFKSRVDRYEFEGGGRAYRLTESRFFDPDGREISTMTSTVPQKWKPASPTAERLVFAAQNLPPFGSWKVITYQYADGTGPKADDASDVAALKDSLVFISTDGISARKLSCRSPSFELRDMSDAEAGKRLSTRLDLFGITSSPVRTLLIKCKSETSLMFLSSPNKAVLLWDGMFLTMEREDRRGFTLPPINIK